MRYALMCLLLAMPVTADTIVIQPKPNVTVLPRDTTLTDGLNDVFRRQHEREVQRRQQEHELEMLEAARKAEAPPAPATPTAPPSSDQADIYTAGYLNGHAWNTMRTLHMDLAYVVGHLDAMRAMEGPIIKEVTKCECSPENIANGVTKLYEAEPAYARLPIAVVIRYYVQKALGVPQSEIDARASSMLATIAAGK